MTQPPPLPETARLPPPLPPAASPPPLPSYNPYSAPLAQVEQQPGQADLELADRGSRLGAYLLDSVFIVVLAIALVAVSAVFENAGQGARAAGVILALLGFLAYIGFNLVLLHRHGQTLGKRIVGIRIVRTDGSRCELWRIIVLRVMASGLLQSLPFIGWIIFLVDSLMIFGDERRCLHDIFADTIVVRV
ncbi:RDD family protein [Tahibacter harae]|uniref:RDD family protein n=1 Tax=Tahibacter harae TaxID=2963937 RepID=A0ABT1QTW3_9GAMM|nr:RDD family protein [Tahibacter harae]MCQ4165722.1 RDD family protein [Tahibacter harae]